MKGKGMKMRARTIPISFLALTILLAMGMLFEGVFAERKAVSKAETRTLKSVFHPWFQKYGSGSVWEAWEKSLPKEWRPGPDALKSVWSGSSKINITEALKIKDLETSTYDLGTRLAALNLQGRDWTEESELQLLGELAPKQSDATSVVPRMEALIRKRRPDEIIIFDVSAYRGMDLFFQLSMRNQEDPIVKLRSQIVYAAEPKTRQSEFFTPEFYRFMDLHTGLEVPRRRLEEKALLTAVMALEKAHYYRRYLVDRLEVDNLTNLAPPSIDVLVLLDLAGLRSFEMIEGLPTAPELQAFGVKILTFATDQLPHSGSQNLATFEEANRITPTDLKGTSPPEAKISSFLASQKVIFSMYRQKLFEKLQSYQDSGRLKVLVEGLRD